MKPKSLAKLEKGIAKSSMSCNYQRLQLRKVKKMKGKYQESAQQLETTVTEIPDPDVSDELEQELQELRRGLSDPSNTSDNEQGVQGTQVDNSKGVSWHALSSDSILVSLSPGTWLPFSGKVRIKVVKGIIEICGHLIHSYSPLYKIYSPPSVPPNIFCIRAVEDHEQDHKHSILSTFQDTISEEVFDSLENGNTAVLMMEGFEDSWTLGLRSLVPEDENYLLGLKMIENNDKTDAFDKLGFELKQSALLEDVPFDVQEILSQWQMLDYLVNSTEGAGTSPKIAIFGGQNTGKSSLARWLTNSFLNKSKQVLYIDLDPGQPEFTVAGMISVVKCDKPLFGPNYTHISEQTLYSVYLGCTNVSEIPLSYIKGLCKLAKLINDNEDLVTIPWVINMMGFVKGLGLDFACEAIKIFPLNTVVQLDTNIKRFDFSSDLSPEFVNSYISTFTANKGLISASPSSDKKTQLNYNFFKLKSVFYFEPSSEQPKFEGTSLGAPDAKKKRELAIISYFTHTVKRSTGFSSVVPFIVPVTKVIVGLDNFLSALSIEAALRTMNGNLIALCNAEESMEDFRQDKSDMVKVISHRRTGGSICLGYGLVRSIDLKQQLLFVVTPVPPLILEEKVNCIIPTGNIELPKPLFRNQFTMSSSTHREYPYVMNTEKHRINSRLHNVTKKLYVPNRVAAHNTLRKCLL